MGADGPRVRVGGAGRTYSPSSSRACGPCEGHSHALGAYVPRVRLGGASRPYSTSQIVLQHPSPFHLFVVMVVLCDGPVDRYCLTLVSWRERDHVVPIYDAVAMSVSRQSHNTTSHHWVCWACQGHEHAMGARGPRVHFGGAGRTCSPSHQWHVGPLRVMHMPRVLTPARPPRWRRPHLLTIIIIGMLAL